MINLEKHTINLGTGDVGVQILQGGSAEKPIPVFAFYNLPHKLITNHFPIAPTS